LGFRGASLRPVDGLPLIRDADLGVHVTGRSATVKLARGTAEISPGRRLVLSNAVFELPDMNQRSPPAKVRFRLDGPVPAAAELLASEKLRDMSGSPFDPLTSRGTVSAQVMIALPLAREVPRGSVNFNVNLDLNNFSAEKMLLGQKVEAALLKIAATNQAYQIVGDVKICGTPAKLEYRKVSAEADAEVRIQTTLDEAARPTFGFDLGSAVTGLIPVKVSGRAAASDKDSKFTIEADLTAAKIDNLLPGWIKPAGRPVRATFSLLKQDQITRFEDVYVDGSG